jgi:hypothetical protein
VDGIIYHKTVDERPPVMRACRTDREHLGPAAHQHHLLVATMADQLAAVGKIAERDALDKIRPVWLRISLIVSSHFTRW